MGASPSSLSGQTWNWFFGWTGGLGTGFQFNPPMTQSVCSLPRHIHHDAQGPKQIPRDHYLLLPTTKNNHTFYVSYPKLTATYTLGRLSSSSSSGSTLCSCTVKFESSLVLCRLGPTSTTSPIDLISEIYLPFDSHATHKRTMSRRSGATAGGEKASKAIDSKCRPNLHAAA
jgi:hypothetical protein